MQQGVQLCGSVSLALLASSVAAHAQAVYSDYQYNALPPPPPAQAIPVLSPTQYQSQPLEFDPLPPPSVSPTPDYTSSTSPPGIVMVETARPRRSYIGVGGAIGASNPDPENIVAPTGGAFAIFGKIGFTDYLSMHSAAAFGDDRSNLIFSLTGEAPIRSVTTGRTLMIPYLGGGVLVNTGDKSGTYPVLSTGVDAPISRDVSTTVRMDVGFGGRSTDVGFGLGLNYNFNLGVFK
ncbi:hypothetical protein [Trichothermofontia sp.]